MEKYLGLLKPLLISLLMTALNFIMPIQKFLFLVFALVATDYWTGTRAARERGEVINSKGMRRTVQKIAMYFVAILLAQGVILTFSIPSLGELSLVSVIAGYICATEFRSNLENISSYTGNDLWAGLVSSFPNVSKWILPPKTKTVKDETKTFEK